MNKNIFLFVLNVFVFHIYVLSQNGAFGTVTANNARGSAPLITLTSPNTCADIGNLRTGTAQVRNLTSATLDHFAGGSPTEANLLLGHGTTSYVNTWFRVTIAAGSGISGIYITTTQGGTAPTTNTGINNIYANVWTGTTSTITQQQRCTGLSLGASLERFDNMIAYPTSFGPPYIAVNATERINVTAGTTYYIEIWSPTFTALSNANINFDVQVVPLGPIPSNTTCASATSINISSPVPLSCNLGAVRHCSNWDPTCFGTLENTVFYTFTKPASGNFSVQLNSVNCQFAGANLQTAIFRLAPGSCSSLTVTGSSAPTFFLDDQCINSGSSYTYTNVTTPAFSTDPPGTQYILMLDGNTGSACSWGSISVLPISLSDFEGFQNENEIQINWITHTEENNDYFEILKSEDGVNFFPIETIKGAGNSVEKINYATFDRNPREGVNYYKLKQVDFDGAFTISDPIAVLFKGNKEVNVYPNPSTGSFKISNLNKSDALKVYDVFGKEIADFELNENQDFIEVKNLKSGLYLLYIDGQFIEKVRIVD